MQQTQKQKFNNMRNIQSISIWCNGEIKSGTKLKVIGTDDYETMSTNNWKIYDDEFSILAEGSLTISGQDYIDWGNLPASSINEWIYNWVAEKLNLVII